MGLSDNLPLISERLFSTSAAETIVGALTVVDEKTVTATILKARSLR
ncbi:hypothetical protein GCWU000246_01713 [Jonquetella anthropi E3_33 E1]|nr:hypothetical protein GCWU000246_01713 [Jonquetella anthropi E3_33 E1]